MGEGSDLPSWARAGQKVVCIKVGGWVRFATLMPAPHSPSFADVLTISHVVNEDENWWLGFVGYEYLDIFWIGHFRPLAEGETEAELFRARKHPSSGAARHLLPQGEKAKVVPA